MRLKFQKGKVWKMIFLYFIFFAFFTVLTSWVVKSLFLSPNINDRLSNKYTEVEKKYFIECATDNNLISRKSSRWNDSTITYSISETFTKEERTFIIQTLSGMSKIKGVPKFLHVNARIQLKFNKVKTESEFYNLLKHPKEETKGFVRYGKNFFNNNITSAVIYMKPNRSQKDFQIIIQHEIVHSLGIYNHPRSEFRENAALGRRYFTIENSFDPISTELPNLDQAALELLYDEEMPISKPTKYIARLIGL